MVRTSPRRERAAKRIKKLKVPPGPEPRSSLVASRFHPPTKKIDPNVAATRQQRMEIALDWMAYHDMPTVAAEAAGVSAQTLLAWRKEYPDFAASLEVSRQRYFDRVREQLHEHAFTGVERLKTIDKWGRPWYEIVKSERLLEFIAKTDPQFRDKLDMNVTQSGGVLVLPGNATPEEYLAALKLHNEKKADGDGPAEG